MLDKACDNRLTYSNALPVCQFGPGGAVQANVARLNGTMGHILRSSRSIRRGVTFVGLAFCKGKTN